MDAIASFADHVVSRSYKDLSSQAISAAKVFLLDALGVGVSGMHGQWADELSETIRGWGHSNDSRVLGQSDRYPCATAALVNAFQIHNSEFDCVHEGAVVHPMASILGASLAVLDREEGVSGKRLIEAIVLGTDVSCGIGTASNSPLRFFRPGTAGGFGATAAIAKLLGFDKETLLNAFGTCYGQSCGTMQSHEECSMLLALQIGFNTRNAVIACDLAARGLVAPRNVLEGRFGFFNLFEGEYDIASVISSLGHNWQIEKVSHKPFPTGRATQGAIDAAIKLKQQYSFGIEDIHTVQTYVTPLTARLVGRKLVAGMAPNYARLCLQYSVARALVKGALGPRDFYQEVLDDPTVGELGKRVNLIVEPNDDPNALGPSSVELLMRDGRKLFMATEEMPGSPSNPLTREQHLQKFKENLELTPAAVSGDVVERVITLVDNLEQVEDARSLLDLLCPA